MSLDVGVHSLPQGTEEDPRPRLGLEMLGPAQQPVGPCEKQGGVGASAPPPESRRAARRGGCWLLQGWPQNAPIRRRGRKTHRFTCFRYTLSLSPVVTSAIAQHVAAQSLTATPVWLLRWRAVSIFRHWRAVCPQSAGFPLDHPCPALCSQQGTILHSAPSKGTFG